MLDPIDSISQFIFSTQNYEQKGLTFRMRKDKFFCVQEKSRFVTDIEDQNNSSDNHQSPRVKGLMPQRTNFILRLTSVQMIQSILIDPPKFIGNIIVLDVSNSRINNLPDGLISSMPNLQIVNLQNNLISDLPNSIYQVSLVQLNINNNLLKGLRCESYWQNSLERLDIGKNHVRQLPRELWKCKKLSTFDIRSNDFETLSGEILNVKKQICALGIDWVKYSLSEYHPDRNDILSEQDLVVFWKVLEEIIKPNDQIDDSLDGETVICCYDFIRVYDTFNPQPEKKPPQPEIADDAVSYLYLLERQPNEQRQVYGGHVRSNTNEIPHYQDESVNLDATEYQQADHVTQTFECQSIQKRQKSKFVMHMAVRDEDLGVLRALLQIDKLLADQVDEEGQTPLSLAIQDEKYHCAKILLNSHVDVNKGGGPAGSCINQAVQKGQYYLLRDLLQANGSVHQVNKEGNGPLHFLIPVFKKSTQEAVKMAYLLLQSGADPNLQNNHGHTPLQIAVKRSVINAVKFAIQQNNDTGQNIFDFKIRTVKDNSTILHLACKSESIRNIIQISFLQPYNLFEYNNKLERPYDIIHKNYTLSKLLQVIENTYIKQIMQLRDRSANIPPPSTNPQILSCSLHVADEDEDMGMLSQGMAQMKMNPKLKKQGNQTKMLKLHDIQSENIFKRQKPKDKIPKENVDVASIKIMVQQKNNLIKLEHMNSRLRETGESNLVQVSKNILQTLRALVLISDIQPQTDGEFLSISKCRQHFYEQLEIASQHELLDIKIRDLKYSLDQDFDIKYMPPSIDPKTYFTDFVSTFETEQMIINTNRQINSTNINHQFEMLQKW